MMLRSFGNWPRRRLFQFGVPSQEELAHRDLVPGMRLVEALLARDLVGRGGERDQAGPLVPLGLHLGPREEREKARHAGVVGGRPCPPSPRAPSRSRSVFSGASSKSS